VARGNNFTLTWRRIQIITSQGAWRRACSTNETYMAKYYQIYLAKSVIGAVAEAWVGVA
jgi:hypothetical protein